MALLATSRLRHPPAYHSRSSFEVLFLDTVWVRPLGGTSGASVFFPLHRRPAHGHLEASVMESRGACARAWSRLDLAVDVGVLGSQRACRQRSKGLQVRGFQHVPFAASVHCKLVKGFVCRGPINMLDCPCWTESRGPVARSDQFVLYGQGQKVFMSDALNSTWHPSRAERNRLWREKRRSCI